MVCELHVFFPYCSFIILSSVPNISQFSLYSDTFRILNINRVTFILLSNLVTVVFIKLLIIQSFVDALYDSNILDNYKSLFILH